MIFWSDTFTLSFALCFTGVFCITSKVPSGFIVLKGIQTADSSKTKKLSRNWFQMAINKNIKHVLWMVYNDVKIIWYKANGLHNGD